MTENVKIKNIRLRLEVIWELTKTDLKLRYSGSFLGFVWVFLKPLAMFVVLLFVFSVFFGQNDPYYKLNLLIGLILFNYFSEGTIQLTDSILKNSNLILKLNFSRINILLSSLLGSFINFIASLPILFFVVVIFSRSTFSFSLLGLVMFALGVILLSLLILGFGFFASIIQVRFRDFQQIWSIVLQLLLYATPIIYPLSILPSTMQKLVLLNPLTIIIDFIRSNFLGFPMSVSLISMFVLVIITILLNIFGYMFFIKKFRKITEEI
jgi:ABC-type polysaccharide/polyol phosphate export permease